jgi:hypothetical protein
VAARWWVEAAFGYSRRGMKAPRCAHWLIVPALVIGMIAEPAWVHAAPPKRRAGGAAPPSETVPSEAAPAGDAAGEPGASPADEAASDEAASDEAASDEAAAASDEVASPEPTITVTPRAVADATSTAPVVREPSREATVDPRRRTDDERILVRAGVLAFGVAGAALVPTAVGLHQAAYARRVLDRLDTPSEASRRSEVEGYERSMNRMALVTGGIAVASVVTGALLVGLGTRRRRPAPAAAVAPAVSPGSAGVVLRGRF